jgi:formylglycine-generating enzyme required for sulfatase activity
MIRSHRPRVPVWVWAALIVISLVLGSAGGWYFHQVRESPVEETAGVENSRDVARKLAGARSAVSAGNWLEARKLFEEVREMDPENADAMASLPLIDRRLEATVTLGSMRSKVSPATFTGVPFGEHEVVISLDGYEPVSRMITVSSEAPLDLDGIELAKSSGQLEVVSQPEGADFKVIRTREKIAVELVQVGTTPAKIERLDPGEYQVLMAVEGWPENSQFIKVENNRSSSVSAIFAKGGVNFMSDPNGAEVWVRSGDDPPRNVGSTPLSLADLAPGKHQVELRYQDWPPIRRTVDVSGGPAQDFEFSWERSRVTFTSDPPGAEVYAGEKRIGDGQMTTPFQVELPEGDYQFSARYPKLVSVERPSYVDADAGSNGVDFPFEYGSVILQSNPAGAAVIAGGMPMGRTPLTLPVVPPGKYTFELSKEDHRSTSVSGTVEAGGALNFSASLTYEAAPVNSRDFSNGSGMKLVWIPTLQGWAGAYEVTQAEYEKLTGRNPSYFKAPTHPVDSVTWYDAVKFCEALTGQEKALGVLPAGFRYRLPTDQEWNELVGDQKLDGAISSLFDRQKSTAPVGSLAPNIHGLYDIRGNVWEWVNDWYSQTIVNRIQRDGATATAEWVGTDRKVLRGGAWNRSSQFDLEIGNRMAARPSAEDRYDVGFRVVLIRD